MDFNLNKSGFIFILPPVLLLIFGLFSYPPVGSLQYLDQLVVKIHYENPSQLDNLVTHLDIWEIDHERNFVVALITDLEYRSLENQDYELSIDEVQTAKINRALHTETNQVFGIPGYECYRTVEESLASISRLSQDYPDLAEMIDIGDSWEKEMPDGASGYDLVVLNITNKNALVEKFRFFLLGAIHAREYATAESVLRFAEFLLENYEQDPDIHWLLNNAEIHVLPVSNPDGRKIAENGEYWRKNTDSDDGCNDANSWGTDLNRNSSYKWGLSGSSSYPCDQTYRGPSPGSEPETSAIENYMKQIFLDQRRDDDVTPAPLSSTGTMVSLHSYGELILWPWGWTDLKAPNHEQLEILGNKFAFFTSYTPQQANELYKVSGSTDDWSYGELGIASFTFEIGTEFFQGCEEYEQLVYPGVESALLYAAKSSRRPYQEPSGPEITDVEINPSIIASGGEFTLKVIADATRLLNNSNPSTIETVEYSIDIPPWKSNAETFPLSPVDGNFNSSIETAEITVNASGFGPGRHLIYIRSKASNGHWGIPSAEFFELQIQIPPNNSGNVYLPIISKQLESQ